MLTTISGDDGDYTTDEDLPAAARFVPAKALDRQPSQSSSEEEVPVIHRTPVRGRLPRLGVWTVHSDRPFMIAKNEMKIIMYNRKSMRRFSVDAINNTPSQTPTRNNSIVESSPMISNSGNIMMSAMNNFGDPFTFGNQFLGGQAVGPPEAFYPFTSINADGTVVAHDSSSAYDEDDMDDEDLWNVEDFLEFGEETSGDENGHEVEASSDSPGTVVPCSAPALSSSAQPTTIRSEDQVHPLLDHFDKGVVGSFRRNQNRHQLLTRNIASRDSLAFGGPHLDGTIRGVKSGRLHHANTPITPARKAKTLQQVIPSTPDSPLAHAQLNKKRKFNEEVFSGHKRSKSLI